MEKTEIKVSCIDQVLKITESPILASGGLSEVRVVFSFCEKWNGFEKTAIFYRDDEPVYYSILDENDTCIVPWEVCYEEGTFKFGVFGDKGVTRRTSLEVKYKVKKGAITADTMPSDPTPAVYDQIMSLLGEMRESQAGFISVAEKAVVDANTATQEAQTATANANTATASANKATQDANSAASNANAEAGNATKATEDANTATANANKATSDARTATAETNTARENIVREAGEILASLSDAVYAAPIECTANGDVIALSDASNQQLAGLTLYGRTVQNGTPTPSAPVALESVGASGSIGVTVVGKNLLNMKQVQASPSTPGSLSGAVITDECIDIVRQSQWDYAVIPVYMIGGKTYTLWCEYEVYNRPADATGNTILTVGFSGVGYNAFEVNKNTVGVVVRTYTPTVSETRNITLNANTNSVVPAKVRFKVMLVEGAYTTATIPAFEPYKGQTLTANAEGGLHGIGEVKDEIDFARGVRVRRLYKHIVSEADTIYDHNNGYIYLSLGKAIKNGYTYHMCSVPARYTGSEGLYIEPQIGYYSNASELKAYAQSNCVEVIVVLAEPIETPLTAEELAAFATLRTGKPNTTAFNDAGADMKLNYVADTKLYIDQKIAAISAALLNT